MYLSVLKKKKALYVMLQSKQINLLDCMKFHFPFLCNCVLSGLCIRG